MSTTVRHWQNKMYSSFEILERLPGSAISTSFHSYRTETSLRPILQTERQGRVRTTFINACGQHGARARSTLSCAFERCEYNARLQLECQQHSSFDQGAVIEHDLKAPARYLKISCTASRGPLRTSNAARAVRMHCSHYDADKDLQLCCDNNYTKCDRRHHDSIIGKQPAELFHITKL